MMSFLKRRLSSTKKPCAHSLAAADVFAVAMACQSRPTWRCEARCEKCGDMFVVQHGYPDPGFAS